MKKMQERMQARGFAYVEVMLAAFILALCAVPAANAIRNGLDAGTVAPAKAIELQCVRNRMEAVLAEPYLNLNAVGEAIAQALPAPTYNLPADTVCAARTVDIALQFFDGAKLTAVPATATDEQRKTALLKIRVSMAGSPYSFTTVLAR